jgi:hypothetical protein
MNYLSEIIRISVSVEEGGDLYSLVGGSPMMQSDWYCAVMQDTNHAHAYGDLQTLPHTREEWVAASENVAFFTMCADVREHMHD